MDYAEARAAFFQPRDGAAPPLAWDSPARRIRDAIEPIATICFWSEPAYDAYAACGLDFLQGYVWSRACPLGQSEPAVVAAAFGVFEPGLIGDLLRSARETCSLQDVRGARERGAVEALRACLGEPTGLADVVSALRRGTDAADPTGRALHAGLTSLPWPESLLGQLWHACSLLREHRGDTHLAALVTAGVDGLAANVLTELWVGWDPLSYTGSRAWSPEAMDRTTTALEERGWVSSGQLTDAGRDAREQIEAQTDAALAPVVTALGADLDQVVGQLVDWSQLVIDRGWFPPDPFKRASG